MTASNKKSKWFWPMSKESVAISIFIAVESRVACIECRGSRRSAARRPALQAAAAAPADCGSGTAWRRSSARCRRRSCPAPPPRIRAAARATGYRRPPRCRAEFRGKPRGGPSFNHDRIKFRDVTGRCAVASAGAAAVGVGLCVFAAPEIIVGAIVVTGVVVLAVAIKEEWDAYERGASRERARPEARPRQPNPKNPPGPKRSPEPFILPNPTPEEREEWRKRCLDYYVRCSEFVKGDKQWRVYGERQCQSCWLLCERTGKWPAEANEKPCPGGS